MAEQQEIATKRETDEANNAITVEEVWACQRKTIAMIRHGRKMQVSQVWYYVFDIKTREELERHTPEELVQQMQWHETIQEQINSWVARVEISANESAVTRVAAELRKEMKYQGQQLNEMLNETALLRRAAQAREEQQQTHMKEIKDELAYVRQQLEESHQGKTEISVPGPTIPEGESTMSQEPEKPTADDIVKQIKTKNILHKPDLEEKEGKISKLQTETDRLQTELQEATERAKQYQQEAENQRKRADEIEADFQKVINALREEGILS